MRLQMKLTSLFDSALNVLYLLASFILALLTLTIITEIFMRTFWGNQITGTVEITGYVLVYITFLGAAWLLRDDGHVKMDLILSILKPEIQVILNIITSILGAIVCFIITWYGAKATWYSYQTNYMAVSELEVPIFIIIFIIPVGSFLLFIQFLRRVSHYLRERSSRRQERAH